MLPVRQSGGAGEGKLMRLWPQAGGAGYHSGWSTGGAPPPQRKVVSMQSLSSAFDPAAFWSALLALLSGAWIGLPPGETDPQLLRVLPEQVVVAAAWSAPGPGNPQGPGVSGFAADPEIQLFLGAIREEIRKQQQAEELPEEELAARLQLERLMTRLSTRPACAFIAMGEPPADVSRAPEPLRPWLRLRAGLAVNGGAELPEILTDLRAALARLPGAEVPEQLDTFDWEPSLPGLSISVRRVGDRLLLGLGPNVAAEMATRLGDVNSPLTPQLQAGLNRLQLDEAVSFVFVDIKEVVVAAPRFIGLKGQVAFNAARAVGLGSLDYGLLATTVVDDRVVQRGLLATNGLDGVLQLAAGEPLQSSHLGHVPVDADFVLASSISLGRLHPGLRSALQKSAPFILPLYDQSFLQLQKEFGFDIHGEAVAALGDIWVVHSAPSLGGWTGTGAMLSVQVRDRAAAEALFHRLTDALLTAYEASETATPTRLQTEEFQGHTLYVFRMLHGGGTATPCLCLTDEHIYLAQHPQALKAQLRFIGRPHPETFAGRLQGERAIPADAVSLIEIDSARLVNGVWTRLPTLVEQRAILLEYADPSMFPVAAIPSAAAILPYVAPTRGTVVRTADNGLELELRNPLSSFPVLVLQAWLTKPEMFPTPASTVAALERGRVALEEAIAAGPVEATGNPAAGKAGVFLLKAMTPDDIESAIPQAVFDKIEQAASKSPEERQRERLERQRLRRERRLPTP